MYYYIEQEGRKVGPFDLISMLRKIRCGRLQRTDIVWLDWSGERVSANQVLELYDIFQEYEDATESKELARDTPEDMALVTLLKSGVDTITQHVSFSIFAGLFLAIALLGSALLQTILPSVVAYPLASVWSFFLFTLFQLGVLKKNRMQIVTPEYYAGTFKRVGFSLFTISVITGLLSAGIPSILAAVMQQPLLMGLLILPGSIIWFLLFFAPLIVADRRISSFAAMGESATLLRRIGLTNLSVLYTIWMLNFIFGFTGILLVVTLPLTVVILCDAYDNYFNHYEV
jgi:hypothetical protein